MTSPQIFISYRSTQRTIVERLADALQRVGFDPILDYAHFPVNANVSSEIIKAIDGSVGIVSLLTEDLFSPDQRESAWVRAEIGVARQFGRPVIPVLYGVTPDAVRLILDPPSEWHLEAIALAEVKDRLQSLCCSFPASGPTDSDIGTFVRKVVATYRQPADACFNEDSYPRYRRLIPGVPHARLALRQGGIAEARDELAFGRTIVLVPTDRLGTPGGVLQNELLGNERLPLGTVTPTSPRYLGPSEAQSISYVQVTSFADTPSSTTQRDCIAHALALSRANGATLVMTALPGTGPHHGHPTYSAVRSLLVGALSYYWKNRLDPDVPWLTLVLDPTSQKETHVTAWLRKLPTAQSDLNRLLSADQILLAVANADYGWVGRGSTLQQVVRQLQGGEMRSISGIGIQLGYENKPVTRRANGEPFRYSPDTKVRETIIEHGDRLMVF
jgi:hypothetical protein